MNHNCQLTRKTRNIDSRNFYFFLISFFYAQKDLRMAMKKFTETDRHWKCKNRARMWSSIAIKKSCYWIYVAYCGDINSFICESENLTQSSYLFLAAIIIEKFFTFHIFKKL